MDKGKVYNIVSCKFAILEFVLLFQEVTLLSPSKEWTIDQWATVN